MADKKKWSVLVGEYTSLAFMLPVATFVGYAFGYLLDKDFGTHWIYIPGLLSASPRGFVQLIRHFMRDTHDDVTAFAEQRARAHLARRCSPSPPAARSPLTAWQGWDVGRGIRASARSLRG